MSLHIRRTRAALACCCLALALLAGCATPPQTRALQQAEPAGLAATHLIEGVRFYPQREYQCGPAALAMLLDAGGLALAPDALVPEVYVPDREGSFQVEMLASARRHGRLAVEVSPDLRSLLGWLDRGQPVLVLQNLGVDWYPVWHYSLAIGYDLAQGEMVLHSGEIASYRVAMGTFERTWGRSGFWGMVALAPGRLPYRDDAHRYFAAVAALEETHPDADTMPAWEAGATAWPGEADIAFGLANARYRAGDAEQAGKDYAAIIAAFPDYLPAYNNLASVLVEQGKLEAAVVTAREGLARAGGSHAFLEQTLAEALAKQAQQR